jgi:hypothetical protein
VHGRRSCPKPSLQPRSRCVQTARPEYVRLLEVGRMREDPTGMLLSLFRDERTSFLNVKIHCVALQKNFSIQETKCHIEKFSINIVDFK